MMTVRPETGAAIKVRAVRMDPMTTMKAQALRAREVIQAHQVMMIMTVSPMEMAMKAHPARKAEMGAETQAMAASMDLITMTGTAHPGQEVLMTPVAQAEQEAQEAPAVQAVPEEDLSEEEP